MPEQEGQREGEDHRTVIARERVIRRVVQEGIADVIDKRTIVREAWPRMLPGRLPERHRHFDHQLALRLHLAAGPHSQRIAASAGTILIRSFARKVAKSIIHSGEAGWR
jgi:hypothetical protein